MKDKIIECDPNDEGSDCDNCPNPCMDIEKCEYCICPIECVHFKRDQLLTTYRLLSKGFDPHDE